MTSISHCDRLRTLVQLLASFSESKLILAPHNVDTQVNFHINFVAQVRIAMFVNEETVFPRSCSRNRALGTYLTPSTQGCISWSSLSSSMLQQCSHGIRLLNPVTSLGTHMQHLPESQSKNQINLRCVTYSPLRVNTLFVSCHSSLMFLHAAIH